MVLKKGVVPFRDFRGKKAPHNVTEALAPLQKDCKRKIETLGCIKITELKDKEKLEGCLNMSGNNSTDWKKTAWRKTMYKLCNNIDCNEDTNVNDLLMELESCLVEKINECLNKTQRLLLLNYGKWVLNNGERKIATPLHIAGKVREIIKMLYATQTR